MQLWQGGVEKEMKNYRTCESLLSLEFYWRVMLVYGETNLSSVKHIINPFMLAYNSTHHFPTRMVCIEEYSDL